MPSWRRGHGSACARRAPCRDPSSTPPRSCGSGFRAEDSNPWGKGSSNWPKMTPSCAGATLIQATLPTCPWARWPRARRSPAATAARPLPAAPVMGPRSRVPPTRRRSPDGHPPISCVSSGTFRAASAAAGLGGTDAGDCCRASIRRYAGDRGVCGIVAAERRAHESRCAAPDRAGTVRCALVAAAQRKSLRTHLPAGGAARARGLRRPRGPQGRRSFPPDTDPDHRRHGERRASRTRRAQLLRGRLERARSRRAGCRNWRFAAAT